MVVIDLPEQCETVDRVMAEEGLASRVSTHPMNVLSDQPFPKTGTKAWWMSQFLDCFSPSQIVSILKKAHAAMEDDAVLYILEPLIGRQPFPVADACLAAMSLYFTALANGTSRFYPYDEFEVFVEAAGFEIERVHDGLGMEPHAPRLPQEEGLMMPDFDIASHVVLAQGLSSGEDLRAWAQAALPGMPEGLPDAPLAFTKRLPMMKARPHESGRKACLRGSPCT